LTSFEPDILPGGGYGIFFYFQTPDFINFADGDLAPLGTPDGLINAADRLIAIRIVTGSLSTTALELAHGDLYPPGAPDGVINLSDLILLDKQLFQSPAQ